MSKSKQILRKQIMLYNQQGQQVVAAKHLNSRDNAAMFSKLHEKLENKDGTNHPFFRLEERVKLK